VTRFALLTAALLGAAPVACAAPPGDAKPDAGKAAASLLETTKVWKAEVRLSADDWKAMQPKGGGPPGFGPPGGGGRPQNFKFSYEFPYVKGTVAFADDTLTDVGVRFKGNGTYMMSANSARRPFRLDFNRYTEDGQYRGLKALSLANNVMDATRVREAAAYDVFRAAGVPAPRTTFVELSLHVPGKHDHQLLGVYTAAEPIDKTFLKRHFKSGKGMLLKPEKLPAGFEYLGDEWAPYADRYGPKDEPTDAEKARLIAFTKLLNGADDATFKKEVGDYLDVDKFLRFLASASFLSHYDSFIGLGHNYVVYLDPGSNKFVLMPWDADHAFGAFFPFGQPEQLADASILHPHGGDNKLIDRLLAVPEIRAEYLGLYRKLSGSAFEPGRVAKVIAACEAAVKEPVARELKATPRPGGGFGGGQMSPADFVAARAKSVAAQLAGQKTGFVPRAFGAGPLGGGFGPPVAIKQPDPAKCVDACRAAAAACEATAKRAAEQKHGACEALCVSCSRACLLCAELSTAKSLLAGDACVLCEKLCLECAAACGKLDGAAFRECEKACRACARACAEARR
jgi:spore coat protein H